MISADYWIQHLNLTPHPEGGFFTEVFRSNIKICTDGLPTGFSSDRRITTSIYYMLRSQDVSKMHRIKSDVMWYYHHGSPIKIHIINREGKKLTKILGPNPEKAEHFYIRIPAGNIFAAELTELNTYGLFSCVVSPGFEYEDFEMFDKEDLKQAYPKHAELFERFC